MCVGHRNGAQREACPSGSHRPDQCWIVGYTATRAIRKNSQFKDTSIADYDFDVALEHMKGIRQ